MQFGGSVGASCLARVRFNLDRRVADVEVLLQHLGDFEEDEGRGMLGDNMGRHDGLLSGDAPQVEIMDFVDDVKLKRYFIRMRESDLLN